MPSLAIVVSTPAVSGDLDVAVSLATRASARDIDVGVFFMDAAVADLPARRADIDALAAAGCDLAACGESAHRLGLGEDDLGMLVGSQDDHAAMVHRADRVLAFT